MMSKTLDMEMAKRFTPDENDLDELLNTWDETKRIEFSKGCILDDDDFHDALAMVFNLESGIERLKDHLIAITGLCEGGAVLRTAPIHTAEHLSSLGTNVIGDADRLRCEVQRLAALLYRNWDHPNHETTEVHEPVPKEAA